MAISDYTSHDLTAICIRAAHVLKDFAIRWRMYLILAGLFVLIVGGAWAIQAANIRLFDLQLKPLLLLIFLFPFISIIYGIFGLQILASTGPEKIKIGFWNAFHINTIAEVSQILPIPGAAVVRAGALANKGMKIGFSAGLVVLSAIIWLALALLGAGIAIVYDGQSQGFLPIFVGAGVCIPILAWIFGKAGAKITLAFLVHKIVGLIITAARMFVTFAALDVLLSPATSFIFSLAVIAGSTAAITPAGLGISEVFGSVLSGMTDIDSSIAFLAIALDRLASLLGFVLIAGVTLTTKSLVAALQSEQNILFITRKWPPSVGGMETYSKRLSEELSKLIKTDVIFLPGRVDGLVKSGLPLLGFGMITAVKLLIRKPASVTHFGDMAIWPLAIFSRVRSRHTSLVISAHGTDVSYPLRGGLMAKCYHWYLKLGARLLPSLTVIANSRATAEVTKIYGFRNVKIVPLGTDAVEGSSQQPLRPTSDLLFAGRIIKLKGLSWFVENVLPSLHTSIRLRVAGTVWDETEGQALNHSRVDYLGHLSQQELYNEYGSALCVVIPNIVTPERDFEGFGLTAIEAAAAGGVVLASDHGGLKEAIVDSATGFHIASGDTNAWIEKIEEIQNWKIARREAFVVNSASLVTNQFSWQRVASETLEVYYSVNWEENTELAVKSCGN